MSLVEEVINKVEQLRIDSSSSFSQRSKLITCYKAVLNEHSIPAVNDTRIYRLLISLGRKETSSLKQSFTVFKTKNKCNIKAVLHYAKMLMSKYFFYWLTYLQGCEQLANHSKSQAQCIRNTTMAEAYYKQKALNKYFSYWIQSVLRVNSLKVKYMRVRESHANRIMGKYLMLMKPSISYNNSISERTLMALEYHSKYVLLAALRGWSYIASCKPSSDKKYKSPYRMRLIRICFNTLKANADRLKKLQYNHN